MTFTGRERFDVAAIRRAHPIETVVVASGVELTRRGQGFMGCCPFHDDSNASLSVGGVPDRFHCFGCDAGGDVIEYVARFTGPPRSRPPPSVPTPSTISRGSSSRPRPASASPRSICAKQGA